jgi:hypothetical protein
MPRSSESHCRCGLALVEHEEVMRDFADRGWLNLPTIDLLEEQRVLL